MNERELSEQFTDSIPESELELATHVADYSRRQEAVFRTLAELKEGGNTVIEHPDDIAQTLLENINSTADAFTNISVKILDHNSLLNAVDDWVGFASVALTELNTQCANVSQQELLQHVSKEELEQYAKSYIRAHFLGQFDPSTDWVTTGYSELFKDLVADMLDYQENQAVTMAFETALDQEDHEQERLKLQSVIDSIMYDTYDLDKIKDFIGHNQKTLGENSSLYATYKKRLMGLMALDTTLYGNERRVQQNMEDSASAKGFVTAMTVVNKLQSYGSPALDINQLDALKSRMLSLSEDLGRNIEGGKSFTLALIEYPFAIVDQLQLYDFAYAVAQKLYGTTNGIFTMQDDFYRGFAIGYELYAQEHELTQVFDELQAILDGNQ